MSPRTAAQNRGINRERQVRKFLEGHGWWVSRASGSLGDADLVAIAGQQVYDPANERWWAPDFGDDNLIMLIEVKSTAGAFTGFKPPERRGLLAAAELAGADAWLCWWPTNGQMKWIPPVAWPPLR